MSALTPTQQTRVQHARDMLAAHAAGGARQVAANLGYTPADVYPMAYGAAMAEVGILLAVIGDLTGGQS